MLLRPISAEESLVPEPVEDVAMLVSRARAGDSSAFATLYRRHVSRVYAFSARRLESREAAEEATQETFTRALAGIGRCRDDAAFPGWLFGIAHHVISEQYRAGRYLTTSLDSDAEPADPDSSPEERALTHESTDELQRARNRCLTEKERTIFDLLLADLTDAQIAVVLGKRAGAVRTAHWRLLIKLRGCLSILSRLMGGQHAHI